MRKTNSYAFIIASGLEFQGEFCYSITSIPAKPLLCKRNSAGHHGETAEVECRACL